MAVTGTPARAGSISMPLARSISSVAPSVEASSRLSWSSAVGPTSRLPKLVRQMTTPLVLAVGTGRMIDWASLAAALSKTTNWPLRGRMVKPHSPSRRWSTISPYSPAQLTTARLLSGPPEVSRFQASPSKAPPSTSVPRRQAAPFSRACCR